MTKVLGITGGIATGKSTVVALFKKQVIQLLTATLSPAKLLQRATSLSRNR